MRTLLLVGLIAAASVTAPVAAQTGRTVEEGARQVLERPDDATHLVRGGDGLFGVWHTDAWVHEAGGDGSGGEANELGFQHESGEAIAVALFDPTVIPLAELRDLILESAMENAPDLRLVREERRTVNGVDVLYLECEGEEDSFSFQATLYADGRGTLHVMTVIPTPMLARSRADVDSLHRGLVVSDTED
jgi:hypothetical protein